MSELRKDPIVGRWVIIAPERAKRPIGLKNEPAPAGSDFLAHLCSDWEQATQHAADACQCHGTRLTTSDGTATRKAIIKSSAPAPAIARVIA